jgi:hypothetical protein
MHATAPNTSAIRLSSSSSRASYGTNRLGAAEASKISRDAPSPTATSRSSTPEVPPPVDTGASAATGFAASARTFVCVRGFGFALGFWRTTTT